MELLGSVTLSNMFFFFLDFSLFPLQYLPCQRTKAIKLKSKIENKIKKINSNFAVLPFST